MKLLRALDECVDLLKFEVSLLSIYEEFSTISVLFEFCLIGLSRYESLGRLAELTSDEVRCKVRKKASFKILKRRLSTILHYVCYMHSMFIALVMQMYNYVEFHTEIKLTPATALP
jgi:hypothetical protein